MLIVARDKEACASEVSRKKAAGVSLWLRCAEMGRPWRVQGTSALAYRRGQRRGNHHASKVFPFPFRGAFPYRNFFCTAWRPHCGRFSLLPLPCRNGCRQMLRLTCFLYVHLVLVMLKASMPCNSRWNHVWRKNQQSFFPFFFDGDHSGLIEAARTRLSAQFLLATFLRLAQ